MFYLTRKFFHKAVDLLDIPSKISLRTVESVHRSFVLPGVLISRVNCYICCMFFLSFLFVPTYMYYICRQPSKLFGCQQIVYRCTLQTLRSITPFTFVEEK